MLYLLSGGDGSRFQLPAPAEKIYRPLSLAPRREMIHLCLCHVAIVLQHVEGDFENFKDVLSLFRMLSIFAKLFDARTLYFDCFGLESNCGFCSKQTAPGLCLIHRSLAPRAFKEPQAGRLERFRPLGAQGARILVFPTICAAPDQRSTLPHDIPWRFEVKVTVTRVFELAAMK
jgi:hypothetical protein